MHIKSILSRLGWGQASTPLLDKAMEALKILDENAEEYDPRLAFKTAEKKDFDTESLLLIVTRFRSMRQRLLKGANERRFRYFLHYLILQLEAFMLLIDMKELFAKLYAHSGDQTLLEEIADTEFAKADPEYLITLVAGRQAFLDTEIQFNAEIQLDAEDALLPPNSKDRPQGEFALQTKYE